MNDISSLGKANIHNFGILCHQYFIHFLDDFVKSFVACFYSRRRPLFISRSRGIHADPCDIVPRVFLE